MLYRCMLNTVSGLPVPMDKAGVKVCSCQDDLGFVFHRNKADCVKTRGLIGDACRKKRHCIGFRTGAFCSKQVRGHT